MHTIKNERLMVSFRYAPDKLFSERFESIGVVDQICLDGKHRFCEPEQRMPGRITCNGVGLCGEYVWDELAREAAPKEWFPKIGVGLLKQRPEGGNYNMWRHYEVKPYPTKAEFEGEKAVFTQESVPCMGVAARLTKEITLYADELHMKVTLENQGERVLKLAEYQHNFLSLNGAEVGPGYRLEIPFAQSLAGIENLAYDVNDVRSRKSGFMETEGNSIVWNRRMDGHGYHMDIPQEQLDIRGGAYWKLTHRDQCVSVAEKLTFCPSRVVLWGVEHCICTEVYIPILVIPGHSQSWTRIWKFSEEKTYG